MKHIGLKQKIEKLAGKILTIILKIIVKCLPEAGIYCFSRIVGNVSFLFNDKRRKKTLDNLNVAFKNEKSPQEIKRIAKQVFYEIAESGADTVVRLLKDGDLQKTLIQDISIEGADYLNEALENKKGVICIGAHFGNFLLLSLRLSLQGYPCNMIVKDADNPVVAEIWHNLMRGAGIPWIPARPRFKAVADSMKWLRKGGILFFYADQHKKGGGVSVEFFDLPAHTVEGPAMLHLKTDATILCAFIIRLGRKKHKIVITPPIPSPKTGNREDDVHQITQVFTKTIEDFVRKYPEQWWWPHKRWKRKDRAS